jgi:hypothetical protein
MSYDATPEWTKKITLPETANLTCPECGRVAFNAQEALRAIMEHDYYHPRHVPPYLLLTCGNPDCPSCDGDFRVYLSVHITVVAIERY